MGASVLTETRYTRFMRLVASLAAMRNGAGRYDLYERLKGEFQRDVPDATPEQYEQAMPAIARAAGV